MTGSCRGLQDYLAKYASLIEERKKNCDTLATEFLDIKQQAKDFKDKEPALSGARESNKKKNRYKDILPFDATRVALTSHGFDLGADYINANFVKDPAGIQCYIAAQGPMETTVNDFWRMILQFKVKLVIMACRLVELGKPRCHKYWSDVGTAAQFGKIKVTTENEKNCKHGIKQRELTAVDQESCQRIIQLHFCDWPDHGAPVTTEPIIELLRMAREIQPQDNPPLLIHCSAGCGRTGAIIAIDYAKKLIKAKASEISIMKIVTKLREQRPAMVQTREQYEYLYEVVRELVTAELGKRNGNSMDNNATYVNMVFPTKQSADKSKEVKPPKEEKPLELSLPNNNLVNLDGVFRRNRSLRTREPKVIVPPLPRKASESAIQPLKPVTPPKPKELSEALHSTMNGTSKHDVDSATKRTVTPYAVANIGGQRHAVTENTEDGWLCVVQTGKTEKKTQPKDKPKLQNQPPPIQPKPTEPLYTGISYQTPFQEKEDNPPLLPKRTPESFVIVKDDDASHNTSDGHFQREKDNQEGITPSSTAKQLFNAISRMKNMGKKPVRLQDDVDPLSTSPLDEFRQVNLKNLGFPYRLNVHPKGTQPPPAHWNQKVH